MGFCQNRLLRVDTLLQRYLDSDRIPGAVSLIAKHGKIVHHQCYGKMTLAPAKDMVGDTIFRMYSMTKPLTAVAIMMLYEQGQLLLDDPVAKYIPAFKNLRVFLSGTVDNYKTCEPEREMIIKDLLTHTAGLTYDFMHNSTVDALYRQHGIQGAHFNGTLAELIEKLGNVPLLFSPGTKWNYSMASEVLAYLVETISGMRLDQFIDTHICKPLGMSDTGFFVPESKHERFAANYTHLDLIPKEQLQQFANYGEMTGTEDAPAALIEIDSPVTGIFSRARDFISGGGGLVSTATDYFRFAQMLLNKGEFNGTRLLGRKTVELMTINHLPTDLADMSIANFSELRANGVGFGLGFAIMLDPAKANMLGSKGEFSWGGGANTMFFVDPLEDIVAILLTQLFPSTAYTIRQEFRTAVYQALMA